MILSDIEIQELIDYKNLVSCIQEDQIQPASLDIRLSDCFCIPCSESSRIISLDSSPQYQRIISDRFVIQPKSFVLGSTIEYIKLPDNLTAFVEGRSSYGRLGLFIQNAGWVDPGFEGTITLELFNASDFPIELVANKRIGQLVFAKMNKSCLNPYRGKYQYQDITTGSKIYEEF